MLKCLENIAFNGTSAYIQKTLLLLLLLLEILCHKMLIDCGLIATNAKSPQMIQFQNKIK